MYRYIGNKSKLLPQLMDVSKEVIGDGSVVADLMAGTGLVSLEYRKNDFQVIASDIMTYSYHHLVCNLLINKTPLFNGLSKEVPFTQKHSNYEDVLNYLNNLPGIESFFYEEFSPSGIPTAKESNPRKYFTSENASKIDSIREKINQWIHDKKITEIEESLLKHTMILSVNRIANISGTYGYFLSKFKKNTLQPLELKPVEIDPHSNIEHTVLQGYAEEVSKSVSADLVYLDPPYMKRQYAANYHILETLARGDFPDAIGKSGLRDWWDQHSSFCTKTKGLESFEQVIGNADANNFIISYSEDGLFTLDQLVDNFKKFGKVSIKETEHLRFRSNKSKLSNKLNEYAIIIKR